MTDLHTHILPGMDDGSDSPDLSISMIRAELAQGINGIALTPHFYPNMESLKTFLNRREESFGILTEAVEKDIPDEDITFYPGAEVYYFDGIESASDLSALAIGDTGLLLVEMPFEEWNSRILRSLLKMAESPDYRVVVAHIERYGGYQKNGVLQDLRNAGVYFQSNADFFIDRRRRRTALRMLAVGLISFIGTDCHNMTTRKPELDKAFEIIEENLGNEPIQRLKENEVRYGLK